jgi:hypothetical protein
MIDGFALVETTEVGGVPARGPQSQQRRRASRVATRRTRSLDAQRYRGIASPTDRPALEDRSSALTYDVFIVHADHDTPFVRGALLPMLGLPRERVILSSELPFPALIEQAIESSVRRSRLTLAVLSPDYLRDRWAGFAELLSRNVRADALDGGSLVPLLLADCEVPAMLSQQTMLDFRDPRQWDASVSKLRQRLSGM